MTLYTLGTPDDRTSLVGPDERLSDYRGNLERIYDCRGHVASEFNPKRCRHCWTHVTEERD